MNHPANQADFPDDPSVVEWLEEKTRPFDIAWEQALSGGERPRIEDHLVPLEDPHRHSLFRELLLADIQYRVTAGDRLSPNDYVQRFPKDSELIQSIFSTATTQPPAPATDTPEPDLAMTCTFVAAGRDADDAVAINLSLKEHDELRGLFRPGVALQGRYVIERELGKGAMGQVYQARDSQLQRTVAIKVIQPRLVEMGYDPARFLHESQIGANLLHPAIATVFDHGTHGGKPFTVFEYLPGQTLAELIEARGRLPLDEVRLIIGLLAQALDLIHSRGIIHRDLKPDNIRANEHGQFKILDFGLARQFLNQPDWRFCGTRAYASPEQAGQLPCDGRSDQYALAVIAYELLTGCRPCEHRNKHEFEQSHPNCDALSRQRFALDLPESVGSALMCALRKSPNERFASCEEFAVAMGCQLLSNVTSPMQVLLEADVLEYGGSFLNPVAMPSWENVHIVLTADVLWSHYRDEISRWAPQSIVSLNQSGKVLQLKVRTKSQTLRRSWMFSDKQESHRWGDHIRRLMSCPQSSGEDEMGNSSVEPPVLIPHRPQGRYQLLGPVEGFGMKRRHAEASIQIRAAMVGADAIIEVGQERLVDFKQKAVALSGLAIRGVHQLGHRELALRRFAYETGKTGPLMVTLVVISSLIPPAGRPIDFWHPSVSVGLIHAWPLALATLFWLLRWPQLVRPASLAILALAATKVAAYVSSFADIHHSWGRIGHILCVAIITGGFYVAGRAWRTYPSKLELSRTNDQPSARAFLGRVCMLFSILFAMIVGSWQVATAGSALVGGLKNFKTESLGSAKRNSRLHQRTSDQDPKSVERLRQEEDLRQAKEQSLILSHKHELLDKLDVLLRRIEARSRTDKALSEYQEAVQRLRRACDENPEMKRLRFGLSETLGELSQVLRIIGRPADATNAAVERKKLSAGNPVQLYKAACDLAACAAVVEKDSRALTSQERTEHDRYAGLAIDALRESVAAGFSDLKQIQDDPALAPIRDRPEYKELFEPRQ